MKSFRNILSSAAVFAVATTMPTLLVGCGAEAISEGELDPQELLAPSADGKDATLRSLGIDSEKRGADGNVNYLAGRIPLSTGAADELKSLVLSKLAATYQLAAGTDLQIVSDEKHSSGFRFVRMQQLVDGVAVTHGHIAAHIAPDGAVLAILGQLVPNARATVAAGDGAAAVKSALAAEGASRLVLHAGPTPTVFTTSRGDVVNAWHAVAEYQGPEGQTLEDVFVGQRDGALLARYSKIHHALTRQVYDLGQTCLRGGQGLPGKSLFSEGGSSTDSAAMGAYDGVGNTYWFYKNFFGRDSYDGKGAKLVSSVHAQFNEGNSCSGNNAVWMGYPYNQMAYGDGDGQLLHDLAKAYDVTGHELTHAVTGSSSNLVYQGEPGALNEAMSDIHGVAALAWKRGGGSAAGNPAQFTVDAHTWLVGESAAGPALGGPALRYMNDRQLLNGQKEHSARCGPPIRTCGRAAQFQRGACGSRRWTARRW